MKTKILILLVLLITFTACAQGVVTTVDRLKIKIPIKDNNATRVLVQDSISKEVKWVLKSSIKTIETDPLSVKLTGDQTISGKKTFTDPLKLIGQGSYLTVNSADDETGSVTISTDDSGLPFIQLGLTSNENTGTFRADNIDTNSVYQLPNKSGTMALTSDITIPNLQNVIENGNTFTNEFGKINLLGNNPLMGGNVIELENIDTSVNSKSTAVLGGGAINLNATNTTNQSISSGINISTNGVRLQKRSSTGSLTVMFENSAPTVQNGRYIFKNLLDENEHFVATLDDISGKANVDSPTFTGAPTAPTATVGTNTTQIATTAFVQSAANTAIPLSGTTVGNPVTGNIEVLDNLIRIGQNTSDDIGTTDGLSSYFYFNGAGVGAIISNDINNGDVAYLSVSADGVGISSNSISSVGIKGGVDFSPNITDLDYTQKIYVDTKATINSPSLTGTPTAPTATVGTNTTQIATTAFVKSQLDLKQNTITGISANVLPKSNGGGGFVNSNIIDDGMAIRFNTYTQADRAFTIANDFNITTTLPTSNGVFDILTKSGNVVQKIPSTYYALASTVESIATNQTSQYLDEGNGSGIAFGGRDRTFYGNIGVDAIDFSYSEVESSTFGATGESSFAAGIYNISNGYGSTTFGYKNTNNSVLGFSAGVNSQSNGYVNTTIGVGHDVTGTNITVVGQAANIITENTSSNNITTSPVFVVGNGTIVDGAQADYVVATRSDALIVRKDGVVEAPSLSVEEVEAGTENTLVTKAWAKKITVRKISTAITLDNSDNGKVILLTASATVTLPDGLVDGFNCSFATQAGATLTYSFGAGTVLINNAGTTMLQLSSHTLVNTGTANEYLTVGL